MQASVLLYAGRDLLLKIAQAEHTTFLLLTSHHNHTTVCATEIHTVALVKTNIFSNCTGGGAASLSPFVFAAWYTCCDWDRCEVCAA